MTAAYARVSLTAPTTVDLDALIERAVAGDESAFASLYRLHADGVHGLITRLVGPRPEREDLLQEVFVRFHRALPSYRREAAVSSFLHRITVRACIDHLRARRRRPEANTPLDDNLVDPGASPDRRVDIARALAFLDELDPKQRIAFVLREVLELSYPEIGHLMGSFTTTARMRVAAATRALAATRRTP